MVALSGLVYGCAAKYIVERSVYFTPLVEHAQDGFYGERSIARSYEQYSESVGMDGSRVIAIERRLFHDLKSCQHAKGLDD